MRPSRSRSALAEVSTLTALAIAEYHVLPQAWYKTWLARHKPFSCVTCLTFWVAVLLTWSTCGSWERVVKPSVTRSGTGGDGSRAIFLDPPYATSGDLYAHVDVDVALAVRQWCTTAPREQRIILCGYDAEHDDLLAHGWTVTEGKAGRGAGYSANGLNGRRERLWLSPACIGSEQPDLFAQVRPVA